MNGKIRTIDYIAVAVVAFICTVAYCRKDSFYWRMPREEMALAITAIAWCGISSFIRDWYGFCDNVPMELLIAFLFPYSCYMYVYLEYYGEVPLVFLWFILLAGIFLIAAVFINIIIRKPVDKDDAKMCIATALYHTRSFLNFGIIGLWILEIMPIVREQIISSVCA